jgi:hypothetical protein
MAPFRPIPDSPQPYAKAAISNWPQASLGRADTHIDSNMMTPLLTGHFAAFDWNTAARSWRAADLKSAASATRC